MNYIKYILIFFVFSIFASIGNMYSKKYYNRLQELEELLNMLNVFKAKIKFTAQSIQEIFEQIYQDNQDCIGKIFKDAIAFMQEETGGKSWELAVENSINNTSLQKEDIDVLKSLGKMLGNTDLEGQVSQIDLTINLLKEQIKQATEEKNKNSKLYKTLGIATGLTMAIILV